MPDMPPPPRRIGIVVPSTNFTVEADCQAIRIPGLTTHTARVTVKERPLTSEQAFMEHVAMMRDGIAGAVDQVAGSGPDHIIMGVALEAYWGGVAAADALQADLAARATMGISLGSKATVAALHAMGCRRIAVLTPHQPRGDAVVRTYYEEAGFDVVRLLGLACPSPGAIAKVPEAALRDALMLLNGPDVEAIVQVGTALQMMRIAAAAERWLDKPVLAINPVTYWDALRRIGIDARVEGFGRILERF